MKTLIVLVAIIIGLMIELKPSAEAKSFDLELELGKTQSAITEKATMEEKLRETIDNQKNTETIFETVSKDSLVPIAVPVLTPEEAAKVNENLLRLHHKKEENAEIQDTKIVAETETEDKPVPTAVPVLTPEEAIKANKEAIKAQQSKANAKAIQSFIHKIELNSNRIHFALSLLPLLLIFDILLFKKKKNKKSNKLMEYISLPRRVRILFSVSLLVFGIFVFVPWSVYFGNSLQFPFAFQDFVNWNLRVLTISIIAASIVLLLIPPVISDYLVAIIAGLGMCVYVQAMFMNQHLGTMDGVEPVWSEHRVFGTINLIIWIAIVLTPIALKKLVPTHFSKIISSVTGIVLFLEVLATISMLVSAGPNAWSRLENSYYVDGSKQFQFSKEKNVILFVMDKLSSNYVEQCFEGYPETKEIVKDFIWYADACSNYHSTFLGLSHELTGVYTPGSQSNNHYEMFEKMWHSKSSESFYKQINDSGYDARFYISQTDFIIGTEDCYHDYFSNIQVKDIIYDIDYDSLHDCLRQMSAFSFVPYFAKKHFFYSFDFFDNIVQKHVSDYPTKLESCPSKPDRFLEKMISMGISTNADKPILAYYYTLGTHDPWYYDEKCNRAEVPFDNPIPTTRCCFYILSEFIRLLKKEGVYDNTAILLCSDHGAFDRYDMTFMIKPFHENKTEISIDHTKVQSVDVLPTLLSMACGGTADFTDFEGYPSFNVPNERIRKVYETSKRKDVVFDNDKTNALKEYTFDENKSFMEFVNSDKTEYFIRSIPLGKTSQEDNN